MSLGLMTGARATKGRFRDARAVATLMRAGCEECATALRVRCDGTIGVVVCSADGAEAPHHVAHPGHTVR